MAKLAFYYIFLGTALKKGGGGGGEREREELFIAKLLIANINNKITEMLNKSEPLEAYPSEGFW